MSFSVVIPTYNEEKRIKLCLESILNQSLPPDEIIIIDQSTDSTKKIAKRYATVIDYPLRNIGRARYHGITLARNEWVCSTDGDTVLDQNYLDVAKTHLQKPNIYLASGPISPLTPNFLGDIQARWHHKAQGICEANACFKKSTFFKLAPSIASLPPTRDGTGRIFWKIADYGRVYDDRMIVYTRLPSRRLRIGAAIGSTVGLISTFNKIF